jgi:pyrroline-5-carboxylate reductase
MSEKELEEITLLTGSGPALFYEFARSLSGAFTSLSPEEREELTKSVMKGVAASVSEDSFDNLIHAVTSKGGVTIAVLEEWRRRNLSGVLSAGVQNGIKRTEELKALLLQS